MLEQMPKSVQERFLRDMAAGKIQVENWVPWWHPISTIDPSDTISPHKIKIEIISQDSQEEETQVENPPEIIFPIKPLSSLLVTAPSPLIAFNVINVLYAYAFTIKYFNGDLRSAAPEAVEYLSRLSDVIGGTAVYQNANLAIQAGIENSLKVTIIY
jgi:hypothetical protein